MTTTSNDPVDPARAGVDVQGRSPEVGDLSDTERSTATELGENLPLTDAAADATGTDGAGRS